MKNRIMLLFILFFMFPFFVDAASYNEHIYMIEKFDINGDSITIGGYSFISHRDNYGGKNLSTYIIVHNNNWSGGSCSNTDPNCYKVKASVASDSSGRERSFWASRCTKSACKFEQDVINDVANGYYIDTSVCNEDTGGSSKTRTIKTGSKKGDVLIGSSCLYYKVGFVASVDLNKVYEKFSDRNVDSIKLDEAVSGLNFKIESVIDSSNNSYDTVVQSEMGVYKGLCTKNGNQKCEENGNIVTKNFNISLGNMGTEAYYDATYTNAKILRNNQIVDDDGISKRFAAGPNGCDGRACNYVINAVSETPLSIVFSKEGSPSIMAYAFQLQTYYNPSLPNLAISVFPFPSSNRVNRLYWTSSDRIQVVGELKINKLQKRVKSVTCSEIFGTDGENNPKVDCGENGSYNQCKLKKNIVGTIYYPTSKDCGDYNKVLIDSSNNSIITNGFDFYRLNLPAYIEINVVADVLLNQTATFEFGSINPNKVYAGKGFSLGKTTYNNTITWVNANYVSDGKPYYIYGDDWSYDGSSSCRSVPLDLSGDKANKVYYKDKDGKLIGPVNIETAFYEAINTQIIKNTVRVDNVNKIKFKSCDSNDSSKCNISNLKNVSGSWINIESNLSKYTEKNTLGKSITNKYEYNLFDSYVVVTGDEAGLVKYKDEVASIIEKEKATGKKFYIDFKWNYNKDYPFNLAKDINPSLLNIMDWKLNGVCNIEVEQGYYRVGEGDGDGDPELNIRYRSINVNDPFPKKNIPVNWLEWYNKISNENRLKLTYHNLDDPLYHITLSKFESNDNKVQISEINKIKRHYLSFDNLEVNGRSTFVDTYFYKKAVAGKSYCPLGIFDSSCDDWGD